MRGLLETNALQPALVRLRGIHFVSEIAFNCISTEVKDARMNVFGFLSYHLLITLSSFALLDNSFILCKHLAPQIRWHASQK